MPFIGSVGFRGTEKGIGRGWLGRVGGWLGGVGGRGGAEGTGMGIGGAEGTGVGSGTRLNGFLHIGQPQAAFRARRRSKCSLMHL